MRAIRKASNDDMLRNNYSDRDPAVLAIWVDGVVCEAGQQVHHLGTDDVEPDSWYGR